MKILNDLISKIDFNVYIKDIRQGVFHTAVLSRYCGLAATLPRDALKEDAPLVEDAGSLLNKTAKELSQMACSGRILEAAIGMATINSLLEVDLQSCVELNAAEVILKKGEGRNVAVVGHFPFLKQVRDKAKCLWVIEKNPRESDFNESEADHLIPQADIVAITGTSLTNHTLEHLLKLCNAETYIIMLGDTVPLSPVLFDYGVDVLSGTRVTDPEIVLKCVSQGANFRQIKGTKRLTMFKE